MTALARRSVDQAWLTILRRRHPDVAWILRPRSQRDTPAAGREISRRVTAENEQHPVSGRAA